VTAAAAAGAISSDPAASLRGQEAAISGAASTFLNLFFQGQAGSWSNVQAILATMQANTTADMAGQPTAFQQVCVHARAWHCAARLCCVLSCLHASCRLGGQSSPLAGQLFQRQSICVACYSLLDGIKQARVCKSSVYNTTCSGCVSSVCALLLPHVSQGQAIATEFYTAFGAADLHNDRNNSCHQISTSQPRRRHLS
jgi:hypothetical protein